MSTGAAAGFPREESWELVRDKFPFPPAAKHFLQPLTSDHPDPGCCLVPPDRMRSRKSRGLGLLALLLACSPREGELSLELQTRLGTAAQQPGSQRWVVQDGHGLLPALWALHGASRCGVKVQRGGDGLQRAGGAAWGFALRGVRGGFG